MHGQLFVIQVLACVICGGIANPPIGNDVLRSPETQAVLNYKFSLADSKILDEIQFACFQYFWKEVGSPAALVKDRLQAPVSSIAAVGFQLASLPIGVEHGWPVSTGEDTGHAATTISVP